MATAAEAAERASEPDARLAPDAPLEQTLAETMLALLGPVSSTTTAATASRSAMASHAQAVPVSAAMPAALLATPAMAATTERTSAAPAGLQTRTLPTHAPAAGVGAMPGGLAALVASSSGPSRLAAAPGDPAPGALSFPAVDVTHDLPGSAAPLYATAAVARAPDTFAATATPVVGTVALPATPDDGLDDGFGQRIVWMTEHRITQAEMRVSPEGAGSIEVRLQVDGHRVTAQFAAANPEVRQALEAGMGRLRDLLGQHGMELSDAHVGRENTGQRGTGREHPEAQRVHGDDGEPVVTTLGTLRARGLIDLYA